MTANVLSSTEVGVNWTDIPEINRNGIIIFYEVLYEQLSISTATIVNTSNLFIILNDLEPGQIYNISVRGVTSVGSGPYSTPEQMVLTDEDSELFSYLVHFNCFLHRQNFFKHVKSVY